MDKFSHFLINIIDGEKVNYENIFNNTNPVVMEIGSGKGDFISTYSRFYPEINFLGIELKDKRINSILKKLDIDKNKNVKLIKLFVDKDIHKYIEENSIQEIIIYHPDPWPKTRHHKNRLIQNHFIDALKYMLKPGGRLRISTDDENYADWIVKLFKKRVDFISKYDEGFAFIKPEDHLDTYFDIIKANEGNETRFMIYNISK